MSYLPMQDEFIPSRRSAFLIPSGPNDKKHLFFLITDRCKDGFHLAVSISSIKEGIRFDETCILEIGEHSFIRDKSFAFFRQVEKLHADKIIKLLKLRSFVLKDDCSEGLCEKLVEGLLDSAFTPRWAKKYLSENYPNFDDDY